MLSSQRILKKLDKISQEVETLKIEIKKSASREKPVSLMGKFRHLPEIPDHEFEEVKKIWRPRKVK
jgi:hypothetical protein